MCPCKKKCSLEPLLKYLEGFFEYVGSPQSSSRDSYYSEVYENLLTSLYQLDDNGNKVTVDWNTDSGEFVIDVNRPVYVGSLKDNSNSNYVTTEGQYNGNYYNDIFNLGFKPASHEFPSIHATLSSFIIDADEDSVLPISYNKDDNFCSFSDNVRALCLPKVNFYIYRKYDYHDNFLPQYSGYYGIKRNGYEMIGNYEYPLLYEDTGAIDSEGRIILRAKASVLMLPVHNDDSSKFKLLGHSDGNYGSDYDVEIEEYSFDSSVNYGEEVNARGVNELVHVNFVNADSNYSDLVPTDSYQFVGYIVNDVPEGNDVIVPFGNRWGAKLNDIYCNLNGSLHITHVRKEYIHRDTNSYINEAFLGGLYNTRFLNSSKSMYLYNIESSKENITSIGDTIELSVKRLPVLNLTGKISKSDFDSSKPYIYILRDDPYNNYGLLLCRYDDLDSDLVLQVTDYSSTANFNSLGGFRMLTKETGFTIFCSSTSPDLLHLCNKTDGNATDVYRLVCQPTDMNKEVEYTLTKLN